MNKTEKEGTYMRDHQELKEKSKKQPTG